MYQFSEKLNFSTIIDNLLDHSFCRRQTNSWHILEREAQGQGGECRKLFTDSCLGIEIDI